MKQRWINVVSTLCNFVSTLFQCRTLTLYQHCDVGWVGVVKLPLIYRMKEFLLFEKLIWFFFGRISLKAKLWLYLCIVLVYCSVKKVFLTVKHLCQSLFLITLSKKSLCNRCIPLNFVKFLETPFPTEYLGWLFP